MPISTNFDSNGRFYAPTLAQETSLRIASRFVDSRLQENTPSNFRKSIASAMCSAAIFGEDSMSAIVRAIL